MVASVLPGPVPALEPEPWLIEAQDVIELSISVTGSIAEVTVARRDRVTHGQIVARLDPRAQDIELKASRLCA